MFSDSEAHAPGEQKGFKSHTPHFIPWLRNSLKAHHGSGDPGLNGPYRSSSEGRNSLTPLERAKGIGFFSIQGKTDRAKKGELRCNGMGMLPVVLRGHHILPGKHREDSPARWNQTKEVDAHPKARLSQGDGPQGPGGSTSTAQDKVVLVKKQSSHLSPLQSQGDRTPVRKCVPLVVPPPTPVSAEGPNCNVPVAACAEGRKGKLWDYSSQTTNRHRDLHSSSWLGSDTQGPLERRHGFSSSLSYINKHCKNSQSQKDLAALREPPVEGFNRPLNGLIFSTEVSQRGLGCTTTLRGQRKPRPNSERIAVLGQNQTWVQPRPNSEEAPQTKEAGCTRKVVRNQIQRVVDNLEQVVKALRDVHQEMKEVVQQIDYLTSTIDLNEEEERRTGGDANPPSDSSFSSGSSSSEATVASTHQRPVGAKNQLRTVDSYDTFRRDRPSRSQSPQNVQLCPITSEFLPERRQTPPCTPGLVSSPRKCELLPYTSNPLSSIPSQLQNLILHDQTLSAQRSLPARPPTPGLSPIKVNLHRPISPSSQPHSPGASSIRISPVSPPYPPPALSPSVIIETKDGSHRTPPGELPSAGPLSPSLIHSQSASCPPTDSDIETVFMADGEQRASSAGPSHVCTGSAATAKPRTAQGRRGRKPPPYPHNRFSELTKKVKESRKAPPYPEKRRLLSTTV
ncbi:uncharacterized protein LOC133458421 [Cololabis saira]|uniref:uncharacterized protein LOC133458421 n=1 Tax=Cololabis saira TaxID=129043 RepID=UPI002AD41651|nr:uncharacterized protein LOC133458421 [Cololabis saira]XP_061594273.1 uncharacterized protein LOC133458421 [Cololabis saira]